MNKQNNLPKYWVVKNTGTDDFKVVIDYLNTIMSYDFWVGNSYDYYGYDGNPCQKGTDGNIKIESFKNNPTLLTIEEFKQAIGIEEEFVLPEKWCISRNLKFVENYEVTMWFNQNFNCYYSDQQFKNNYYIYPKIKNNIYNQESIPNGYKEITFEQFKKYVLKMKDNKKIIAYKSPVDLFNASYKAGTLFVKGTGNFTFMYKPEDCVDNSKWALPKEIVETWEPVYEEEIKTIDMGSFNLTVKDKRVFHKNEDITDFVKSVCGEYDKLITTHGNKGYKVQIKDITFSKTGCENNETKLSDWLKVYDMIK